MTNIFSTKNDISSKGIDFIFVNDHDLRRPKPFLFLFNIGFDLKLGSSGIERRCCCVIQMT